MAKYNKVHPEIHPCIIFQSFLANLDHQIWISQNFWSHVKSIEADPAPQASRWAAMSVSPTGDASGPGTDLWLADQNCGLLRTILLTHGQQGVSTYVLLGRGIQRENHCHFSVLVDMHTGC